MLLVRAAPLPLLLTACAAAPTAHRHPHDRSHEHSHDHGTHGGAHRFEDAERWAAMFDDPARDAWQRPAEVVTLMAVPAGGVVADLGAGTGYFLAHLSRAVGPEGRVLALDVEPDMVRYMEDRARREGLPNVEARQVPFDDPGLLPESVDRVLIVNTWHHLEDRARYAEKLARALRPGGAVFIVDFTQEAERGPPPAHRVTPEGVFAELQRAGLRAEVLAEELPDQFVVAGTRETEP